MKRNKDWSELHWYDDANTLAGLPLPHRLCGFYCQALSRITGGKVRDARPLMRRAAALSSRLKLKDATVIRAGDTKLWVDLYDPRIIFAMDEARGIGEDNRFLRSVLSAGDTFLDIGANHGTYSLNAAKVVGKQGRVIAFEPQPKLATLIRKSFLANDFPQGEVREIACSDTTGQSDFFIPLAWSGEGSLYQSDKNKCQQIRVQLQPLDALLAHENLPGRLVLKLDVEGSEAAVLRGARNTIAARRPYIHFEVNPSSVAASGDHSNVVLDLLTEMEYTHFAEVDEYPQASELKHLKRTYQRNLIAIP